MNGRWKSGPSFLKKSKEEWPRESADLIGDDPERKKMKIIGDGSPRTPFYQHTQAGKGLHESRLTSLRFVHSMTVSR